MAQHPLPKSAESGEELAGFTCLYCGYDWTCSYTPSLCPECGETDVKPVTFIWCGQHWHSDREDAGQCVSDREEAAYDAKVDRLICERLGK